MEAQMHCILREVNICVGRNKWIELGKQVWVI